METWLDLSLLKFLPLHYLGAFFNLVPNNALGKSHRDGRNLLKEEFTVIPPINRWECQIH